MRYKIKALPKKKSPPHWKVQLRTFKGKEKASDINKREWEQHGFHHMMTIEEAKERAKQLNAQTHLKEVAEKRQAISERLKSEDLVECAQLPRAMVREFEERLFAHYSPAETQQLKIASHWRAAKRVIRKIKLPAEDWADECKTIYREFELVGWSSSYAQKVIGLLNQWGTYQSKKTRTPFFPIPFPRGRHKQRLADANYNRRGTTNESLPLSPQLLRRYKLALPTPLHNWLFISLWFGLRPSELDKLRGQPGKLWNVASEGEIRVLEVYQSKLTSIARDKRWKRIPAVFVEQEEALQLIESGEFRRPLCKTIQSYFGHGYTTYAGRKGFEPLMTEKGIDIYYTSAWLGHQRIDRTWSVYRERTKPAVPPQFTKKKTA